MKSKPPHIVSVVLFAALGLFYVVFGAIYASVEDLLWFHAAAVPDHAREAVRPIYFALMKLVGGATIALGFLGLWVTFSPLRRGVPFSAIAILIAYAIPLFMAAIVAEILAKATGAPTSWHIMGGLMAVNLTAFIANAVGGRRAA
jgi:hypothetical protein